MKPSAGRTTIERGPMFWALVSAIICLLSVAKVCAQAQVASANYSRAKSRSGQKSGRRNAALAGKPADGGASVQECSSPKRNIQQTNSWTPWVSSPPPWWKHVPFAISKKVTAPGHTTPGRDRKKTNQRAK